MPKHAFKVDFLSFSVRGDIYPQQFAEDGYQLAGQVLNHYALSLGIPASVFEPQAIGQGRGGYRFSVNVGTIARSFTGHPVSPPFVELTGSMLDRLREHVGDPELVCLVAEYVTRLDLCVDLESDMTPTEFVASMTTKRDYRRDSVKSRDGLTEYIGSPKSERMCRVYRYSDPHPRSKLLRVEVQLRGTTAKHYAQIVAEKGAKAALLDATAVYSFNNPLWRQPEGKTAIARTYPKDKENARLLRFWYKTCVPVQQKLRERGLLE